MRMRRRKQSAAGMARPELLVGITACCLVAAVIVWVWFSSVARMKQLPFLGESSEAVSKAYPLAEPAEDPSDAIPLLTQTVVKANPFSIQRRQMKGTSETNAAGSGQAQVETPKGPVFVYKGRVNVGNRQRAVVEDTAAHKTYFLEVGQTVAGFKVLDIAEKRVLLSDLQTGKEVTVSVASTASPSGG